MGVPPALRVIPMRIVMRVIMPLDWEPGLGREQVLEQVLEACLLDLMLKDQEEEEY
jgi:hypothetical protein